MFVKTAHQAPLSLGFSRQENWNGLSFPSPGNFPNLGIKSTSLAFPALAGGFFTTSTTWEALYKGWIGTIKYVNAMEGIFVE